MFSHKKEPEIHCEVKEAKLKILYTIWCQQYDLLEKVGLWRGRLSGARWESEEGNGNPLQCSCWRTPWTEEPGGLQPMGWLRVGHDWATSLSLFTFMHWRRKWQPTPVFLPGESQDWGSLLGCRLWARTLSDTTEAT